MAAAADFRTAAADDCSMLTSTNMAPADPRASDQAELRARFDTAPAAASCTP